MANRLWALLLVFLSLTVCVAAREHTSLRNLGRGIAVVFSPDLSVETNCEVYQRLGFICYQTPSWENVIEDIICHNASSSADPISIVVLETHGTNGNGLKLQTSSAADALRSYAAVGALNERLGSAGVQYCILSACNSRRLLRPAIYNTLDPGSDHLFLPATLGIMNAHSDAGRSPVRFLTRADSHIESLSLANTTELSKATLTALGLSRETPLAFVVSDLLVQLVTDDPSLDLRAATPVEHLERSTPEDAFAEMLFARFVNQLDRLATSDEASDRPLVAALNRR